MLIDYEMKPLDLPTQFSSIIEIENINPNFRHIYVVNTIRGAYIWSNLNKKILYQLDHPVEPSCACNIKNSKIFIMTDRDGTYVLHSTGHGGYVLHTHHMCLLGAQKLKQHVWITEDGLTIDNLTGEVDNRVSNRYPGRIVAVIREALVTATKSGSDTALYAYDTDKELHTGCWYQMAGDGSEYKIPYECMSTIVIATSRVIAPGCLGTKAYALNVLVEM